jgi:hypothetical protein
MLGLLESAGKPGNVLKIDASSGFAKAVAIFHRSRFYPSRAGFYFDFLRICLFGFIWMVAMIGIGIVGGLFLRK